MEVVSKYSENREYDYLTSLSTKVRCSKKQCCSPCAKDLLN
jgi:hypothetical protein